MVPVDHDLATDELVAVERIAEHDVAGGADEDTAVLGLDQLGQPLDGDVLDVEAVGVAGHGLDPGRAGELADHGVARERVGEDHLAAGGRLEVGLMRGEPLVDADVEGDVDLLAGPAEVGVDIRADVAEVVALLTGGERRGRARDRHQGDAYSRRRRQAARPQAQTGPLLVAVDRLGYRRQCIGKWTWVAPLRRVVPIPLSSEAGVEGHTRRQALFSRA